jgi:hypothetical protein
MAALMLPPLNRPNIPPASTKTSSGHRATIPEDEPSNGCPGNVAWHVLFPCAPAQDLLHTYDARLKRHVGQQHLGAAMEKLFATPEQAHLSLFAVTHIRDWLLFV